MNITLIYNDSKFNVDILNDTTCQYLYNIANKVFRLPLAQFRLIYKNVEIENNSRLIFSVLSQIDPDNYSGSLIILVESVPLPTIRSQSQNIVNKENNQNEMTKYNTKQNFKKKMSCEMLCQICILLQIM